MPFEKFLPYLLVMAGVTYLVRVIPFSLFGKKITNRFLNSFLYYTPYAVLSAMTFPAILYATGNVISGAIGLVAALLLAYKNKSLITVASGACLSVLAVELILMYV